MAKNTAHDEISAAIFSLCDFSWREVRLRAAPSFPAKKSTGQLQLEDTPRASERAGGFRYEDSALNYSPCRNRFILWSVKPNSGEGNEVLNGWCALYGIYPHGRRA